MMIGPETYYKFNIEGKSPEEIKEEITRLEEEIRELKKIMKDKSDPAWIIKPSPQTMLMMNEEYLEVARKAYDEAVK